jgi:hypothetical protein
MHGYSITCPHACRRYEALFAERHEARNQWRSRHPARGGRRAPNFPEELSEIPSFIHWIERGVHLEVHRGEDVHGDLQALVKFLHNVATSYRSMYAYGFHPI